MAIDYLGMLGQAGSGLYSEKKFGDAEESIKEGFQTARKSVKEYQQPYQEFGLENIQTAQQRPEFAFGAEEFEKDPSYEFLQEEGARAVQRSSAAKKMLQSGNTLAGLQERGQQLASKEYQAAFDRAKDTYGINVQREQFGMKQGADIAKNMGDNLADIGIMEGASLANMDTMQAQRMSELISDTLASRGQNVPSGVINDMMSKFGGTAGDFLKEGLGGLATKAAGALGFGGAAAGMGAEALGTGGFAGMAATTGEGAMFGAAGGTGAEALGISSEALGGLTEKFGAEALGGSSIASTGFASWAGYAAAGVGGLFALRSVMKALQGPSKFNKAAKKIGESDDPLGYIANMKGDDIPRSTRHSEDNWFKMNDSAGRGALYSKVLKKMTPDQAQALRGHKDFSRMADDLFNYAKSGAGGGGKHAKGSNPTRALIALFPDMAKDIKTMAAGAGMRYNKQEAQMTYEDIGGGGWEGQGMDARYDKGQDKVKAATQRVREAIRMAGRTAGGQRGAQGLMQEWQQAGYSTRREARRERRRARRAERRQV